MSHEKGCNVERRLEKIRLAHDFFSFYGEHKGKNKQGSTLQLQLLLFCSHTLILYICMTKRLLSLSKGSKAAAVLLCCPMNE